tara:strand:+ start:547 stop:699 length:153 start_codon:yes stop_codon:yes gene_type:complete
MKYKNTFLNDIQLIYLYLVYVVLNILIGKNSTKETKTIDNVIKYLYTKLQ